MTWMRSSTGAWNTCKEEASDEAIGQVTFRVWLGEGSERMVIEGRNPGKHSGTKDTAIGC